MKAKLGRMLNMGTRIQPQTENEWFAEFQTTTSGKFEADGEYLVAGRGSELSGMPSKLRYVQKVDVQQPNY